jgi:glucokinase
VILAGDVGGTNARFALAEVRHGRVVLVARETFASREHGGLEALAARVARRASPPVTHACVGIAGVVRDGRCAATNLPWVVDQRDLARGLGLPAAILINDLEATAHGLAELGPADLAVLQAGEADPRGNLAVMAAGTGLGEAGLVWDGRRYRPFATEGGHADWAPRDALEVELWRHLARELGHVSVERVVSGPGLHQVYRFLRDTGRGDEPAWLAEALRTRAPGPVISEAALAGRSELCGRALDLMVGAYGAEAGNLALRMMATGGVYVGGGIAPRILDRLRAGGFLAAFTAKGRLEAFMRRIPVQVVLEERVALLGAARCAALDAGILE